MNTNKKSPSEDAWAVLALLRFFLALIVVIGHIDVLVHHYPFRIVGTGYLHATSSVFGFFILSGFSIAASLESNATGFFRRRAVRIWPLYLFAIALGVFVGKHFVGPNGFVWPITHVPFPPDTTLSIVASLLMLQNIIALPVIEVGPIWSLAPEWWHYTIAPLLKRLSNRALMAWIAVSFVAFLLIKPPAGHGVETLYDGTGLLALSWLWVTGFLYYRVRNTALGFVILAAPASLAMAGGMMIGAPFLITIFVLVLCPYAKIGLRRQKAMTFLGDVSYPLYLVHMPILVAFAASGSMHASEMIAMALGVSVASLFLIDYPARKFLRVSHRKRAEMVAAQSQTKLPESQP